MILDQMLAASFRGVPFLVSTHTMGGGRKVVVHDFINSDRRYIEDLGALQKSVKFEAVITGAGQEYFDARDAIIRALDTPGPGLLVHPLYGELTVVALPYTVTENEDLGVARISMDFGLDQGPVQAFKAKPSAAAVDVEQESAFDAIQSFFAGAFSLSLKLANNLDRAYSSIASVKSTMSDAQAAVRTVADTARDFAAAVTSLQANAYTLMQSPGQLAQAMRDIYDLTLDMATTPAGQIDFYVSLESFGEGAPAVNPTSAEKIEAKKNQDAFLVAIRSFALAGEASALVANTYTTDSQLSDYMAGFDARYAALSDLMDVPTLAAMDKLRVATKQYLDTIKPTLARTITMTVPPIPVSVLSYMLYGETVRAGELQAINGNWPTAPQIAGEITVLSK